MLKKLLGFGALAALLASCVPASSDTVEFGENSPMAAIQAEGVLRVAVPPDSAPFSFTGESGQAEGFLIELGTHIADSLEVDVEFVFADSADMAEMVGGDDPDRRIIGDQDAEVAFPLFPVNESLYKVRSRELGFDVTTPFFVGHQRLLVPEGSSIETTADLGGQSVCAFIDPIAGVPIEELAPYAAVQEANTLDECASALVEGASQSLASFGGRVEVAAAMEPDLLMMLADIQEQDPGAAFQIVGEQASTAGYAPIVVRNMNAWASDAFIDMREDGRWVEAYNKWIAPLTGEEVTEPPNMTLDEAASLYPIVSEPES
ncbi:MAG TPA: transporter substrate-binding domain-containing protein [Actinomycetota bacterium]|nr:transporter substrate-binding domain-containing protein [Actinomycetota bacterium]